MTKITSDPIGMFQRTTLALAKQRGNNGRIDTSTKAGLSPIEDKISISTFPQADSVAQALTKGMREKSFSSIKEYGAYFVQLFTKLKSGGEG